MTMYFFEPGGKSDIKSHLVTGPIAPAPAVKRTQIYDRFFKRALDIIFVVPSIVIVLPIILVAALMIALDGGNPFYSQKRLGRNGSVFRMWKLRTMVTNADDFLQGYLDANPKAKTEWEMTQKLKMDPRITRVGSFLRKTSIDELPQLLNVLKGEMSLVGPRPMMVEQRSMYPGTGYFKMRPGITGLWQTSERNNCQFYERSGFDDEYSRTMSFKTDMSILIRTVSVVLRGTGY